MSRWIRGRLHLALGWAWLRLGHQNRARKQFQGVLQCRGDDFQAHLHLCRIALSEGNVAAALREMSAARRTDPEQFARVREDLLAELPRSVADAASAPGLADGDAAALATASCARHGRADGEAPRRGAWFWYLDPSEHGARSGRDQPGPSGDLPGWDLVWGIPGSATHGGLGAESGARDRSALDAGWAPELGWRSLWATASSDHPHEERPEAFPWRSASFPDGDGWNRDAAWRADPFGDDPLAHGEDAARAGASRDPHDELEDAWWRIESHFPDVRFPDPDPLDGPGDDGPLAGADDDLPDDIVADEDADEPSWLVSPLASFYEELKTQAELDLPSEESCDDFASDAEATRFADLPPIAHSEVDEIDWDELEARLAELD